jgi:hypothetical protein
VQHNAIVERMDALVAEASDDVRVLARLWQLQNKMQSVGTGGSYGAHPRCCQTTVHNTASRWLRPAQAMRQAHISSHHSGCSSCLASTQHLAGSLSAVACHDMVDKQMFT